MSAATDDPTGIPIPKTSTYLTQKQVQDLRDDVTEMERALSDPKSQFSDKGNARKQLGQLKHDLDVGEPPDTTPDQRTALAREEKELIEEIAAAMPSQAEMRRRPPGAVGKHQAFEKAFKPKILRWKNIRRILNKGNDDPDISNLERYRGTKSTLNMDNALIPGKDYFIPPNTPAYREGYDRTYGSKDQAPADPNEIVALKEQLARLEKLVGEQNAVPKKRERKEQPILVARCGMNCKGLAGKTVHERNCGKCKELVAEGDTA